MIRSGEGLVALQLFIDTMATDSAVERVYRLGRLSDFVRFAERSVNEAHKNLALLAEVLYFTGNAYIAEWI